MGNKVIELSGNDIIVDNVKYKGTPGLWSLILLRRPDDKVYTLEDMKKYKKLAKQTNLKTNPHNHTHKSNLYTTWKWKEILKNIKKKKRLWNRIPPIRYKLITRSISLSTC